MEDKELQAKAEKLRACRSIRPMATMCSSWSSKRSTRRREAVAVLKDAMEKKEEPAAATKGTIAEWDGRAKLVLKLEDGKEVRGGVSGSRTEIVIAGQKAEREKLKVGMSCEVSGPAGGEATKVACN